MDWQTSISLIIVTAAVLYFGRTLVRTVSSDRSNPCGTNCAGCRHTDPVEIVTLDPPVQPLASQIKQS